MEGKSIGSGYGSSPGLNQGMQAAEPQRRTTQMEDLGERLGSNLGTLSEINTRLESALDRFHHAPTALTAANPNKEPPPPPSGTLNYLDHLTSKTNEELSRLNDLVSRVRTIF